MKLKVRVADINEVAEPYREQYIQAEDGKSWALNEEFEIEDVAGLKENNQKLLKQSKAIQEAMQKMKEQFGDIDPEKAREAQKKLEELENKELMDAGKFEELMAKRTEAMKRDHQNQIDQMSKGWESDKARVKTLETQLQRTTIINDLRNTAGKLHIRSNMVPLLELKAEREWVLNEDGQAVWKDENGQVRYGKDPAKPANMSDYLSEQIASMPELLEGSTGTGANGNAGRGGVRGVALSREDAHKDMNAYFAAKEKAKEQGLPVGQIHVTE